MLRIFDRLLKPLFHNVFIFSYRESKEHRDVRSQRQKAVGVACHFFGGASAGDSREGCRVEEGLFAFAFCCPALLDRKSVV